jgi:hypothetical protein
VTEFSFQTPTACRTIDTRSCQFLSLPGQNCLLAREVAFPVFFIADERPPTNTFLEARCIFRTIRAASIPKSHTTRMRTIKSLNWTSSPLELTIQFQDQTSALSPRR